MNDMNGNPTPLGPRRVPHDGFEGIPRPPFCPPMGMEMGMMPGPQPPVMMVPGQPGPPFLGSSIFRTDGHHLTGLPPHPVPPHLVTHMPLPHGPPIPPPPLPLAPHPMPPRHLPPPSLPLHAQHTQNTLVPPGTELPPLPPSNHNIRPPLPPDPQPPQPKLTHRPPLPPTTLPVQPPLPPLPPLPPPVDILKPPPPKEPPPPSPVKKPSLPSSVPPQPKSQSTRHSGSSVHQHKNQEEKKIAGTSAGKPIPSIISSAVKLVHQKPASVTTTFCSNVSQSNQMPLPSPLPPPPSNALPGFSQVPNADAPGVVMEEEPYDPEEAMFSPSSSTESSPHEESHEDSLINKYVRNPTAGRSSENFTSSLKTPDRVKTDSKKKRVSFSSQVSFSNEKTPQESPARQNLDARLQIMFGTASSAGDPSPPKVKKSLKLPLPLEKQEKMDDMDDIDQPLPLTPSPFISRRMYLYWHKETVKLRRASKVSNTDFVDSNSKAQLKLDSNSGQGSAKPQINGQILTPNIPPLMSIPPLPKNLPTVPPPNYKKPLSESVVFKESSLKADSSLKNVGLRVHPYKTSHNSNKKSASVKANNLDSEFELSCEAMASDTFNENDTLNNKHEHSIPENRKEKTVGLVMKRVLDDLRKAIRNELTKELLDRKLRKCLKSK